jgi:hypothetical protein
MMLASYTYNCEQKAYSVPSLLPLSCIRISQTKSGTRIG